MRIYLQMPEDADAATRARLNYALRLFCAIYSYQPVSESEGVDSADVILRYAAPETDSRFSTPEVFLSRGYRARDPRVPAPPPLPYQVSGFSTVLHFAPEGSNPPDWLGEIFEWVSCADEYSVTERDGVGRPLFAATYAGRHSLDTCIPYAAIAMRLLQREICRVVPRLAEEPDRPTRAAHFVVPTHDVDYFPAGRLHAAARLSRNAAISTLVQGQPALGLRQTGMAALVALGLASDPLDCLTALAREENRRGFHASYNFIPRHSHRRDAQYTLDSTGVVKAMQWLESEGMEVGIHTSYTCYDEPEGMTRELSQFHEHGFDPSGVRQHWLRFTLDRLIPAIEGAGLAYDSSVGWSTTVGFRAGACFAFPPYNFAEERPATFLEIPLLMMDQGFLERYHSPEEIFDAAARLLTESRRFGWGGVSLLWHPAAFGVGWLPGYIGDSYWRLADKRAEWGDEWISPQEFVAAVRHRYLETGLLEDRRAYAD